MIGKEILNFLQDLSETELRKEVYICGADYLVNDVQSIFIQQKDYTDKYGIEIPVGSIVIEW